MDPFVVFDCEKNLPNRFALALAAAARSRALARGAEPRLHAAGGSPRELALHEIAANVFTRGELAPFLPGTGGELLPPPDPDSRLRGDCESAAAADVSRPREAVH